MVFYKRAQVPDAAPEVPGAQPGGLRGRERAEEGHEGGHGEDEARGGPALKMRVPERKGTIFI